MAETSFSQDQFSCAVCLDLLKDPVAIPCGHSYCMSCITSYWDQEDQKGVYSCPQCRQTFTPRPALNKNTMLTEVVEQLKKTKLQAGPEDVESDVCTRRKRKSVKSRQVCLNTCYQKSIFTSWLSHTIQVANPIHINSDNNSCVCFCIQMSLKERQRKFQQREKDLELREAVESHKVSLEKNRRLRIILEWTLFHCQSSFSPIEAQQQLQKPYDNDLFSHG
uniref:RING-type domain-containing protein n=1 Tax=Sinocyclocheilus anshuiensis TaxID=1608454 RepID=A0A671PZC3_9TELE